MDKRSYFSLLAGLGFSLGLFSLAFTLAFIAQLLTQGQTRPLYLLAFATISYIGWLLTRYAFRAAHTLDIETPAAQPASPRFRPSLEEQILLLARAAKGRLSASEVAAVTHLGLDESHNELKKLVKVGVAEMWVTDEGGFVYVFPEFFAGFKESARDPLEP